MSPDLGSSGLIKKRSHSALSPVRYTQVLQGCAVCTLMLWLSHVYLQSSHLQWSFCLLWARFGHCAVKEPFMLPWAWVGSEQMLALNLFARTSTVWNCRVVFLHCLLRGFCWRVGPTVRPDICPQSVEIAVSWTTGLFLHVAHCEVFVGGMGQQLDQMDALAYYWGVWLFFHLHREIVSLEWGWPLLGLLAAWKMRSVWPYFGWTSVEWGRLKMVHSLENAGMGCAVLARYVLVCLQGEKKRSFGGTPAEWSGLDGVVWRRTWGQGPCFWQAGSECLWWFLQGVWIFRSGGQGEK